MPQIGGHIIIADRVCEKLGNPPEITKYYPAYRLGSVGPDLMLFLFDPPGTKKVIYEIIEIYKTISGIKETLGEVATKILGPAEELTDWLSGGISSQVLNLASNGLSVLIRTAALWVLPGHQLEVPNRFAGMNIPGIPNGPTIPIYASDLSSVFRQFGHPYTSDGDFKQPEEVGDYQHWWWTDILHYRRTGPFASALLEGAVTPFTKAYAKGYVTHLAADVCGHAYVNGVVGGPFRNHVYRHMVVENIIDAWLWKDYRQADLAKAKLDQQIHLGDTEFSQIRDLLLRTMRKVYTENGIVPKYFQNSIPDPKDLDLAYQTLRDFLSLSTDMGLEPPVPPPCNFEEVVGDVTQHLKQTFWHISEQFDRDNKWWEWLLAPLLGGMWALVFLVEIFTLPAEVLLRISVNELRWLLYRAELALYSTICDMRWQLTLGGWGKPSSEDLTRAFAQTCVHIPALRCGPNGFRCYPQAAVDHSNEGFWLCDPGFSGSTVEAFSPGQRTTTECCPYEKNASPSVFVDGPTYDVAKDNRLKQMADPDDVQETLAIEMDTCRSNQFGNASDFAIRLLDGEYPMASFDLDGDMGYAFMSWEGRPPVYEPELSTI